MPANAMVYLSLKSQRRQTYKHMTTPKVALITGITGWEGPYLTAKYAHR